MSTNSSSPEATPRLRRELVCPNWVLRGGVGAVMVLLFVAFAAAAPASAHWRASGSGSTTASVATLLPPTNVSVPASSNSSVAVSWTGSAGAVVPTGYYVTRITGSTAVAACGSSLTTPIAGITCTDSSVPEGTHRYQVTAVHRSWTAAGLASGEVRVTNLRDLSFTLQPPSTVTAGSPFTLKVRATLAGTPLPGVPVTITIANNAGGGTLSGITADTTGLFDPATFSALSIDKAGAGYTLIASSPGYAGAVSSSFTVVPAAATKLIATSGAALTGPASSAATLGPVTLQRQDPYGNAVTAGTSSFSLATSSAGASIFAATANGAKVSTVIIPAGSSSASFFYGDTKAGTATITAASPGLAAPAPVTATITAAAPGRLKFDALPTTILKNTPITPPVTVHVLDAFGNPVDSSAQVMLQANCSIKGTLTRAAASGLVSFPDLEIAGKASGCVLTASSSTLATDTSTPFNAD